MPFARRGQALASHHCFERYRFTLRLDTIVLVSQNISRRGLQPEECYASRSPDNNWLGTPMADDESLESSSRPASPVGPLNNIPSTSRQQAYRFAWDSPHRRPGPPSVADTNDSRADFFNQAPKGSLFLGSSISLGGLGATPPEWSSSKHGLNGESLMFVLSLVLRYIDRSNFDCAKQSLQARCASQSTLITPRPSSCRLTSCQT